jgi:hypothetical protein
MFRQRVEQAAQYLEACNSKAQRKRKLLEAALQLWQATKELGMSPSKRKREGLTEAAAMVIETTSGASVDVPLLRGQGPTELYQRAKDLQRAVLEDIRAPPSAPLQQVSGSTQCLPRPLTLPACLLFLLTFFVQFFCCNCSLSQLAARINALRRGLSQGSIVDEDQSLAIMLREIGALEKGLLQANDDVMAVCQKVMERTGELKL